MTRPPRVVMVSWRDPMHPRSGGAETYSRHALAGLVRAGMEVTWLVPRVQGLPGEERLDGITVVRRGRGAGHLVAAWAYLRARRRSIDLVIDQVNSYPMFTPYAFPGPRLVLIHQLARDVLFAHLPRPVAAIAYAAEPLPLLLYRRDPTVTVSASTRASLLGLGFHDVTIVPNAVAAPAALVPQGPRSPPTPARFVAVGRLVPSKRLEHVVEAFERVRADLPGARLTLIGRGEGPYARHLASRVARTEGAELAANADEATKWRVLAEATALIATSVREGWGLMVSEAHAVGTPSVAYDVPGLRDSTEHGVTGIVCEARPAAAADAMLRLARDADGWRRMSGAASAAATGRTPDRLGRAFVEVVREVLGRADPLAD